MTDDTDIIDMFDHLCWYLCSTRESFVPPEETAEKSLEGWTGCGAKTGWWGTTTETLSEPTK